MLQHAYFLWTAEEGHSNLKGVTQDLAHHHMGNQVGPTGLDREIHLFFAPQDQKSVASSGKNLLDQPIILNP